MTEILKGLTTPDGKDIVLPDDPMKVAELYAEGIVDLSLKLQKGNCSAGKSLLDENDQVIPQPGDEVLTGDDYKSAIMALRTQDKDTQDC